MMLIVKTNYILADPKFVDSPNQDYRLSAESPAIGKGTQLGYTFDLDNTPIAENQTPSISAYYGYVRHKQKKIKN
ncbi:MAG: hypothetical protein IPL55_07435 [Saprospiraceae bacterium]|nr:hypothetical protein [Saprospiraceae bacterium]